MKKQNILLTGSEGFIGRSIQSRIENIYNDKFNVWTFEKNNIKNNEYWIEELSELVNDSDIILHVGADSNTQNFDFNDVFFHNYYFSKVLFDLISQSNNDNKTIYSSSAACYGTQGMPETIYAWSKFLAEQYGYSKLENFISLRYFNVYGPGENDKGNMSSIAYQALITKNDYFYLFPGNPKRDFIFVEDIVEANLHPIFNNIKKGIYDVGTGDENSFEDIVEFFDLNVKYLDKSKIPKNYQYQTKANKNKFMKGWEAKYSLELGLKKYQELLN